MNPTAHLVSLRPGRFLVTFGLLSLMFTLSTVSLWKPPSTIPAALLFFGICFPAIFGLVLLSILHEVLHRPFALTLPKANLQLLRGHIAVVSLLSFACSGVGFLIDPSLPFFALFWLVAAMGTIGLPFEPGFRWAGSRALASAILALLIAAGSQVSLLKESFFDHPILFGSIALSFVILNFAVTFSVSSRHRRATIPFTSTFSALFDTDVTALFTRDSKRTTSATRAHWRLSLSRGFYLPMGESGEL